MNHSGRGWMWLSVGLVLALGIGLGVILDRVVLDPSEISADVRRSRGHDHSEHADRSRQFLERLHRDLDLSTEQSRRIEDSLATNHVRAREFWSDARAQFAELRQEFRADIRDVLDREQRARFEEMIREYEAKRHSRRSDR